MAEQSTDLSLAKPVMVPMESMAFNAFEVWENEALFGQLQRAAKLMSASQLVPKAFQGEEHIADCFVVLGIARATRQDPLMLFQSLYVANGRAGWYAKYAISRANSSGIFDGVIRFKAVDLGEITAIQKIKTGWDSQERKPTYKETPRKVRNWSVTAYASLRNVKGESYVEQTVDMQTASDDGWTQNEKYFTIPKRMLEWRAASWLINLYCPHVLFGLPLAEEIQDVAYEVIPDPDPVDRIIHRPSASTFASGADMRQGAQEDSPAAAEAGSALGTTTPAGKAPAARRGRGKAGDPKAPVTAPAAEPEAEPVTEPSGTVGGAQMVDEGGEPTSDDVEPTAGQVNPPAAEFKVTLTSPDGVVTDFWMPQHAQQIEEAWKGYTAALKGTGYTKAADFWNANVQSLAVLETDHKGLREHLQNLASAAAKVEKAADKAKATAAKAEEDERLAREAAEREAMAAAGHPGDDDPRAGAVDVGDGQSEEEQERPALDFAVEEGIRSFGDEEEEAAVAWVHSHLLTLTTTVAVTEFYEANKEVLDDLGFGTVVEAQLKALLKAQANATPTTVKPAATGSKFGKPVDIDAAADPKQLFAAISKGLDDLRNDPKAGPADYKAFAAANEAIIGRVRDEMAPWYKTMEKRFQANGVTLPPKAG
jgi:hypothetical protein